MCTYGKDAMFPMYGLHGRVLHINLSSQDYWEERLPTEVVDRTIGGKGLGTWLLLREANPRVNPMDPENPLIFAVGPLTGTTMVGVSRYGVYTKSPLTGIYAESYSGGFVASRMKATGYDAFVLHGASTRPVFLEICPGGVTFHSAEGIWGKETYESEDAILRAVNVPGAQAVVIGPAGENGIPFACISNNYWRCAGRTGVGAVLGSKFVKGLAFHGDIRTAVADQSSLNGYVRELLRKIKDHPVAKGYRTYGTPQMVPVLNRVGAFPSMYWRRGNVEYWEALSAQQLVDKLGAKSRACEGCPLACAKVFEWQQGVKLEGPEFETIYAFGGLCGIRSLDEVAFLNDLCNRFGIDTISTGNLIGLVMDGVAQGELAFPITFGDMERTATLIRETVYKRGLGAYLAKGIKQASLELGLSHRAIHVKGLEPPGYDPRILKGMALGYATSPRGACHLRTTFYNAELSGAIDTDAISSKVQLLVEWEDRLLVQDLLIMCRFYQEFVQWDGMTHLLRAVTGRDYPVESLRTLANQLLTNVRRFNIACGLTRKDDFLPPRFFEEPLEPAGEVLQKEDFVRMLTDYYRVREWDDSGKPLASPSPTW